MIHLRYRDTIQSLKKYPTYSCPVQDGNIALGEQCLQVITDSSSYESAKAQCEAKLGRIAPPLDDIQNAILG